ncbi:MAG: hypothetical protein JWR90_1736 [Marmoricola sp.]|jgi:hypothetical protein|nr:hypothetical protein [Marmoricola sp.]
MSADPETYGWLHGDLAWFGEAACVTVARGVTREPFVNAFGVDLASPESRENSVVALDDEDAPALISFTEIKGALVAVEVKGSVGSEPDVLELTSTPGRSASASWDAAGAVRFACAEDGEVRYDGEPGDGGLPAELTLPDTDASPQVRAMVLVEAWTGTRVSAADVERALTLGYVAES